MRFTCKSFLIILSTFTSTQMSPTRTQSQLKMRHGNVLGPYTRPQVTAEQALRVDLET